MAVLSVTMHGLRAEDGVYQRSAGAQSDPTWRHIPEGGAGGEQEELSEESAPPGGAGGVAEGERTCRDEAQTSGYMYTFKAQTDIGLNSLDNKYKNMMSCRKSWG